jgi:hypothetical protein
MKYTSSRRRAQNTFRPHLESLESRLTPTTYTVSSLADSGDGSLRAAMTSVNANAGVDTTVNEIDFSVAGVIKLTSGALPALGRTSFVKIDGRTAPGFAGAPVVEIDNNGFAGLSLGGSNSTLAGLSIVNANGAGVTLSGSFGNRLSPDTGANMSIVGNYMGLALDGSVAANTGAGLLAIGVGDTIGGTAPLDRNVISGNGADGIQLETANATVLGNFIGTDPAGQAAAPNQGNGITISGTATIVGGTDAGAGNIIAFNGQSGIVMNPPNGIQGNSIFSNGSKGIDVQDDIDSSIHKLMAPQLSYAVESPGSTSGSVQVQIGGVVKVGSAIPPWTLGPDCTIQVYATLSGVPGGQGQLFLGSVHATLNSAGFAAFTLSNLSVPAGAGTTFTATATLAGVARSEFFVTSEFSAPLALGGNVNNLFVASAYGLLLNRYPDPGAVSWVNLMNNGDSAPGVVLGIEGSTEYLSEQVAAMYKHYLQRPPDVAGQQAWTSFLLAGGTFEEVAAEFTSTQEYYVLRGGTNQGFITGVYADVLSRYAPSNGEIAGWETALDNGLSRLNVALAFLTSQEYRNNLVEADYETFLLRLADSDGLAAWVNALNAGATDQQVLAQIFGSPEGFQLWS